MSSSVQADENKCSKMTAASNNFWHKEFAFKMILPPWFASDLRSGVEEYLGGFLLRYASFAGGTVLAYDNVKINSQHAEVREDSPFLHFKIECRFLVFSPVVDSVIRGQVKTQSSRHIGVLLFNFFNVSITLSKQGISSQQFSFKEVTCPASPQEDEAVDEMQSQAAADAETSTKPTLHDSLQGKFSSGLDSVFHAWVHNDTGHVIKIGSTVEVQITSVSSPGSLMNIDGKILETSALFVNVEPEIQTELANKRTVFESDHEEDVVDQVVLISDE